MAMDMKVFVHATGADARAACVAEGLDVEVDGEWLRGDDTPDVAESLSKKIAAPVVSFSIQTAVDQIWIQCWVTGKCVRELRYTSDGGWTKRGKAMPFEHSALKGWLKQKKLLASPDGYDVLQCFLGRERSSPGEPVIEPGATQNIFLPIRLLVEAQALASHHGISLSTLLTGSWHLGKAQLIEHEIANATELGQTLAVPQLPPGAIPAFAVSPSEVSPLPESTSSVECRLALSPELMNEVRTTAVALDRSLSWSISKAYTMARSRLAVP